MIAQANDEIRSELLAAQQRRLVRARVEQPFAYLDWTIARLEALHLAGRKRVPKRFLPRLAAVTEMLPDGLEAPELWRTLIRDAIEQCFELQEQLLRWRDPNRARQQELEALAEGQTFRLVSDSTFAAADLRRPDEEAPAVA